ncbi:phage tail protein [Paenibacillus allorhizosphaerae]|uniref:Phage tail collar domain-containing protein n=1 Tax=Paenibacillus allorhizosphaerae TaxID=2849866 RepID=A0ABN7U110_9BACL|nr:tail fiber protein [Paenibacillus allorhizosphaerae]CAG7658616.1 hypothetical protein PAECIP111802_07098 [Paenibacillus allorhizosphaerae]
MSDQYVGEIRLFAGKYAPQGWAFCDGQTLKITDNEVLYTLIGTTYGGDGQTTFALPDMRGRVLVHMGTSPLTGTTYNLAQNGGNEIVTLTSTQLPAHTHQVNAQEGTATVSDPTNAFWAGGQVEMYSSTAPNNAMDPAAISSVGGNQSHDNMMPFLTLTYIIALQGLYPSQG